MSNFANEKGPASHSGPHRHPLQPHGERRACGHPVGYFFNNDETTVFAPRKGVQKWPFVTAAD